jgi:hypothetical protein
MSEFISKLDKDMVLALCGMLVGVIAILAIVGAITVTIIKVAGAANTRRMQLDDMEATLKMEMIQRGMAAEDIQRVLQAKMGTPQRKSLAELFEAASAARKQRASSEQAKQT